MAQIDLGKLKFNWRGTWNNTTAYETDDVVYRNGQAYVAVADEAAGTAAPEENADWQLMSAGINFRGEWNIATTYYLYDTVTEDGGLFILDGADENEGITGADPTLGGDWTAITPAPAQNVLTEIGDMVFRNNEGNNQRLTINPTIGKGLSVAEAPRETYSSRAFTYEENGTGGNTILTAGSVPAVTYTIRTRNVRTNHFTLNGQDRSGTFAWIQEPTVTVNIGDTITFNNTDTFAAHPMAIRVEDGGASVTTGGYTGEGTATVSWDTTGVAAGTYFYQCTNHAGMIGQIVVRDITNRQGGNNTNGTIDVTRGKTYTITLDNVTNGVAYNLFSAAAPQIGAANAITLAEGNGTPGGTTFLGAPITFTFTPNETTPNTVFLASQANTNNMVTITVNDNVYVPSWGQASAAAGDNRRYRHWQDWYGGDCADDASGTPTTFGTILPTATRDPGTDVTVNGTAVGAQQRRLWRGDTGGATTDWIVPDGVERLRVTCIGGGGAGGAYPSNYYGGAGGGGGAWASGEYEVTPGQVLRVVAGHGGSGGWGNRYNGGTTTVQDVDGTNIGNLINLSAEGGEGGYDRTSYGSGGDDVTVGGTDLIAGTALRHAGGDGGYGCWQPTAWGPETYVSGGGGSAGSMYGHGYNGGSSHDWTSGYWVGQCGGGGIGGHGGAGTANYTPSLNSPQSGAGGGGTAGPGENGHNGNQNQTDNYVGTPAGGQGGPGLADGVHVPDYIDNMPCVQGHGGYDYSPITGGLNEWTQNRYKRSGMIAREGARFGDGEATQPADGTGFVGEEAVRDASNFNHDVFKGFERWQQSRIGSRPAAPTINYTEDCWNGVLGRLWGGGGSGGTPHANWSASMRGGDGGAGSGGGGACQYQASGAPGQGTVNVQLEWSVWDVANMAWRVHDKFKGRYDATTTNTDFDGGNSVNLFGLVSTTTVYDANQYACGGHGGCLGGGGAGGRYGAQGGFGGIGGGGGGASSNYSPVQYGTGGHGGVGYVLFEWA